MINGIDVRLPTRAGRQALEVAVRAIRQLWPHAVFENAETGEQHDFFWEIPFGDLEEIFIYRDAGAAKTWNDQGAVPASVNTMIHVLSDEGLITVVVDERTPEMETAIDTVRSALHNSIVTPPVALELV